MMTIKKRYIFMLPGIVLVVLLFILYLDASGNILTSGTQGMACGGEFNYQVQCPTGTYCRQMGRNSISIPYQGGTCVSVSVQPLDQVEEVIFRLYR